MVTSKFKTFNIGNFFVIEDFKVNWTCNLSFIMLIGDQLSTRQLNFTSMLLNTSEIILQLIRHKLISLLIDITSFTLTF